ncbi:MAG: sulfatase-like hydrolase/transferase [Burkholderiaceae bacterium]
MSGRTQGRTERRAGQRLADPPFTPAARPEAFSETAYATRRAIEFIDEQGDAPWCLHLSYIKPHWPYIASAPYHAMYGPDAFLAPNRTPEERCVQAGGTGRNVNPVLAGFQQHPESIEFSQDRTRLNMLGAYMGLVRQIDDHLGHLIAHLRSAGRLDDTMIVFTADHGDFLGDHWQGEKEFMYEASVRVPLIVYDPGAEAQRAAVSDDIVEAVDLLPTFVDALGGEVATHIVEGRSLLSHLRGGPAPVRQAAFAELDYAIYPAARRLGIGQHDARMVMVRSNRYKMVHVAPGYPPILWDLQEDPNELRDLGGDPAHARIIDEHYGLMRDWLLARRNRIGVSDPVIEKRPRPGDVGVVTIGKW